MKGTITKAYLIHCGNCQTTWTLPRVKTQKAAERSARSRKWKKTRAKGWMCPVCSDSMSEDLGG